VEERVAQVTIYLDAEAASLVRKAAKSAGVSQSRWLADLIRRRTAREWPESVRRLAGSWADAPTAEELRRREGKDVRREFL
jgi:hypothetical protein